jgi:ribokinase
MSAASASSRTILVVGSINADIFIDIPRIPLPGETLSASRVDTGVVLPGGKGANQAVAAVRLCQQATRVHWCGRFGNDQHATMLK